MAGGEQADLAVILAEYDPISAELHWIVDHQASASDRRRNGAGTKWTNEQLLFHMVFGFMIVATLRYLVRIVIVLHGARPDLRAQRLHRPH